MGQNETGRKLPMLDNLRVASPCSASWAGMEGDDKVRFCGQCDKNVYNLSAMTTVEAQSLIAEKEGELCIRLYRRKDGTVINADCPVGVRRKRVTRFAAAAMALGGAGVSLLSPPAAAVAPREAKRIDKRLGQVDVPTSTSTATPKEKGTGPSFFEWMLGEEDEPVVEMGDIAEPEPQPMMGAIAPIEEPPPPSDGVPQL